MHRHIHTRARQLINKESLVTAAIVHPYENYRIVTMHLVRSQRSPRPFLNRKDRISNEDVGGFSRRMHYLRSIAHGTGICKCSRISDPVYTQLREPDETSSQPRRRVSNYCDFTYTRPYYNMEVHIQMCNKMHARMQRACFTRYYLILNYAKCNASLQGRVIHPFSNLDLNQFIDRSETLYGL